MPRTQEGVYTSSWKAHREFRKGSLFDNVSGTEGDVPTKDDRIAVTDAISGETYTYKQLREIAAKVGAGFLRELRLRPGDYVFLAMPTGPTYIVVFHACQATGLVPALANPNYTPDELRHLVSLVQAKKVFTSSNCLQQFEAAGVRRSDVVLIDKGGSDGHQNIWQLAVSTIEEAQEIREKASATRLDSSKVGCICFSSGTTGLPKAVCISHSAILAEVSSLEQTPGYLPELGIFEPVVICVPCFHIAGIALWIMAACRGDPVHFALKAPFDFELLADTINSVKAGRTFVVPPILLGLLRLPAMQRRSFPSLRTIGVGAAALSRDLQQQALDRFQIPVAQVGGMTETCGAVTTSDAEDVVAGSVGKVLPGTELRVVSEDGRDQDYGSAGELWVRTPMVMNEYFRNPKATQEAIDPDGWLKTGDIGFVRKDGEVFVVDRFKDFLKVKGMQVAPAELEAVILGHPMVLDCGVVGTADADQQETPRAYVVPYPQYSHISESELERNIQDYIRGKLADYKRLRGGVRVINEIPKNPSGKILRRVLRERAKDENAVKARL